MKFPEEETVTGYVHTFWQLSLLLMKGNRSTLPNGQNKFDYYWHHLSVYYIRNLSSGLKNEMASFLFCSIDSAARFY